MGMCHCDFALINSVPGSLHTQELSLPGGIFPQEHKVPLTSRFKKHNSKIRQALPSHPT